MTRNILRVLCFVLMLNGFFSYFAAAIPAFAQSGPINSDAISSYGLRNLSNAIVISATPATPKAGDSVHFTVEGSVYDFPKDTITWTINGKTVASGVGQSSIDATIDQRGDPIDVVVSVTDATWGSAGSEVNIAPLQVDILYDAPTYVPPFYRGRAMPSAGGSMRVQAIAHLTRAGSVIPDSSITYTWSRNGTVLGSISGLGKSKIVIDSPNLYSSDTISVHAGASGDTISADASVVVPASSVTVQLYEDHPLYGITYFNALQSEVRPSEEITVSAVPYFATVSSLSDPTLQFSWLLNDQTFSASSTKRSEVVLDAGSGTAKLHLDVTSAKNFFMQGGGDWTFDFGGTGGASLQKSGSSDVFHNGSL
jgi:hypothetical protein